MYGSVSFAVFASFESGEHSTGMYLLVPDAAALLFQTLAAPGPWEHR